MSPASERVPIIDAWAQPAIAQSLAKLPELSRLLRQSKTAELAEAGVSTEAIVRMMDEAGIETVLLSAWHRPGQVVFSNDQVAEMVREFPGRFVGVAAVDLEHPVAATRELRRAIQELGFKALRVIPWLWKLPPNDRLYYPLYVECIELEIPFCTQVGHTGPLMPSETGRPIPYIDEIALTFPELVIVGGHIGYPWTDEMLALAWKHENVYIDTSAYLPKYYPMQLQMALRSFLADKILFGTNFPQLLFGKCAEQARALGLPPESERKFLRDNARRVFRL